MDPQFLQTLRYRLQRRIRRLNGIDWQHFAPALKQTWPFIRKSELFMAMLEPVLRYRSGLDESAQKVLSGQPVTGDTELENVGIAFHVLDLVATSGNAENLITDIGFQCGQVDDSSDAVGAFRDLFLEPLYEYLDEQLDTQRAVCALLVKYKHRTEWFARSEMQALLQDSGRGEKRLAADLYRYLYDQGLDFHIEPSSASGETDLLAQQTGEQRLVLDAKVFNPEDSKGKSYLVSAFNQIYTYARDYNESAGYLAIYQTVPVEPRFTFASSDCVFPYLEHNGKVIYFVVIDICDYPTSASKRGQAKVVQVTREDLVSAT